MDPCLRPLFVAAIFQTTIHWPDQSGTHQESIRLGGLGRDGRMEFCNPDANNNLYCFINAGVGDMPVWQPIVSDSSTLASFSVLMTSTLAMALGSTLQVLRERLV